MSNPFTKADDAHLREFYREGCRVDPAILATKLGKTERQLINRLSLLGLRHKRLSKVELST